MLYRDRVDRPGEPYNCGDRILVQGNGTRVSFEEDGVEDMICPPGKS
ncbi:hypothetical protein [Laspinema olomoucense]|uniref:Uncharacterized protein n=1 Tax=Laspinema olomoucense D3b TaxID=2953688 RepID=A0ABT2NDB9_9CYAN|nr:MULTISPECIES: hypothetical protein [unclassified Laspinema]MCT7974269.1 hypothetical protein [Laspinema sp. D3d]MCT7980693.1 hypothetical protein [Laspinema sp. D3b]MCT7996948.1 hypothetical protein [Laspinema sp. D3c]